MVSPPSASERNHLLALAVCTLLAVVIWLRPGPLIFVGVDAACYARIAAEMAERPLSQWSAITIGNQPFYDTPPLALIIEGLWFRLVGASAEAAALLARIYATLLAALVYLVAALLADRRQALWCVLALTFLPGFLYESQNPMLEMPLTVFMTAALAGLIWFERGHRWGCVLFGLSLAAAALTKGPPAGAVAVVVVVETLRRRLTVRQAALLALAGGGILALAAGLYELARAAQGLDPFLPQYAQQQVLASIVGKRTHPVSSPLFYLGPLATWYAPLLLALIPSFFIYRRFPAARSLLVTGWTWIATIVIGFTVPLQKNSWYIHPLIPGAALVIGATLAALLPRRHWVVVGVATAAVVYAGLALVRPDLVRRPQPAVEAVARTPAPAFAAGHAHVVANCSDIPPWRATHLFAFYWGVTRTDCGAMALYGFDGTSLRARSTNDAELH
jgi:4-amino-4-deoxy-L-arabinose transferase-like glycosyltransferase